ncbi:MAG: hypothetical protein AAFY59_06920 [Pseudomonadota bacterium]
MTSIYEYALMADAVYSDDPVVEGWTTAHFRSGLGSGLQAATFTLGNTKVVAFKGTTPSQTSDLVADLKIGTGMNSSYFWDAEAYVEKFASEAGVVVTGHSLGGGIAQVVGNRRRLPFVSFNAPGVGLIASRNVLSANPVMTAVRVVGSTVSAVRHPLQMVRDVKAAFHKSLGVNFRLSGDLISEIGLHYGKIVTLAASGDPLTQHKMEKVLEVVGGGATRDVSFPA